MSTNHSTKHQKIVIVVTGGPSGGKTTFLEALQKELGNKIAVVPEAASILYRGGFPRRKTEKAMIHAQKAIYHTQQQLEELIIDETLAELVICDRGSLDGYAYWPKPSSHHFFESIPTTLEAELRRYDWVIHMDTAHADMYDTQNPIRTENHSEALALNELIKKIWSAHPRQIVIGSNSDFLQKLNLASQIVRSILKKHEFNEVQNLAAQSQANTSSHSQSGT